MTLEKKLTMVHKPWLCTPIKVIQVFKKYIFFGQDNILKCIKFGSDVTSNEQQQQILNLDLFNSYSTSITNISIIETETEEKTQNILILVTAGSLIRLVKLKLSAYCPKDLDFEILHYEENCCFGEVIIASHWISSKEFVVVRGNSSVQLYKGDFEHGGTIKCTNFVDPNSTSILYSASVFSTNLRNLIIFTGTVFSVVGIYTTDQNNNLINLHQLRGHNGVIFGINYCPEKRIILSASDDRTIIVWTIYPKCRSDFEDPLLDPNTRVQKTHCLSYHVARVFNALLAQNTIFSVGEDSNLGMWLMEGKSIRLKKMYASHGGSGIWSCANSPETNQIMSCGNDGSIYKWSSSSSEPFSRTLKCAWLNISCANKSRTRPDFPRSVKLFKDSAVLITTDEGKICVECADQRFENIELSWTQYACLAVSRDSPIIVAGGLKGQVLGFALQLPEWKFLDKSLIIGEEKENISFSKAKILSIHFLSDDFLIVSSILHLIKIKLHINQEKKVVSSIIWQCQNPLSTPQISSLFQMEGVLLCGLGNGDLSILDLRNGQALKTIPKCHSKYGVGGISKYKRQIVSGGRDGKLNFFAMREIDNDLDLEIIKSQFLPFNWIGGMSTFREDLLIYGFDYESFVIYSWARQQIIGRIECAGAHHSWDFYLSRNMIGRFVTICDQKVLLTEVNLEQYFNCNVQEGLHKKQINCACQILNISAPAFTKLLIATGGEDCSVEISSFQILDSREPIEFIRGRTETVMTHTSAVKDVYYKEINKNSGILLSGGGKMELIILRLSFDDLGNIIFYQRLHQLLPRDLPDLRILKLDVSFLLQKWCEKPKYSSLFFPQYDGAEIHDIPTLHVYMASSDGDVWLVRENRIITKFKSLQRNALHSVRVVSPTPKEDNIFAVSSSGILYHWINQYGDDIKPIIFPIKYILISLTGSTSLEVTFHPEFSYFHIISGDQGGQVILWKLPWRTIEERPRITPVLATKFNTTVSGLDVQFTENHSIRCYISTTGQELGILRWPEGNHTSLSDGVADCQGVLACKLFQNGKLHKIMFSYGNGGKLL